MRDLVKGLLALMAIMTLLAGCGGTAAPSPATSAPGSGASSPAAAASASAKPAASTAPSTNASARASGQAGASAASGSIKIGALLSLTGPFTNLGKDHLDGLNLYLKSINNTVAGRKIEIVSADDQGQADVGLAKAKQLVEVDKVQMIVGLVVTPVCLALASYAKEAQIPVAVTEQCGAANMMVDSKLKSPYMYRFSQNAVMIEAAPADLATKKGYKRAVIVASDYGGSLETADTFASAYISRGGSVIQELYAPLGTTDFGPYLAKLDPSADVILTMMPGIDALRFADQFGNYASKDKAQVIDTFGQMTTGPNLAQLQGKVAGWIGSNFYSEAVDTPANKAFVSAVKAAYPDRTISTDLAAGYSAGQILEAVIKKLNGNVEQKQDLLNALATVSVETAKGPVKLDQDHDITENLYVFQINKQGNGVSSQLLQTYNDVSRSYGRTPGELKLPWGQMKNKWVGMTKAQLDQLMSK